MAWAAWHMLLVPRRAGGVEPAVGRLGNMVLGARAGRSRAAPLSMVPKGGNMSNSNSNSNSKANKAADKAADKATDKADAPAVVKLVVAEEHRCTSGSAGGIRAKAGDTCSLDGIAFRMADGGAVGQVRADTVWPVLDRSARVMLPLEGKGCALLCRTGTKTAPVASLVPINTGAKACLTIDVDQATVDAIRTCSEGKAADATVRAFLGRMLASGMLG